MSAFAEFLAYKQRVPVRGAIMLNENMDQVVLVKGWKKGANWSFPRGKINKDENDLDCAVREVYEETGFDIQEAGLVKDEKEMKYIEVTMREQHMRLYVFRGVPMNTHFEPRTRKEISKIEWYKMTDLPTLKKHKHQDSDGQLQAVNANKFYMVAPFLNPLKKWIGQQRKSENRQSLPYLAPPVFSEEVSQDETEDDRPQLQQVLSHGPSNLPEVAYTTQQEPDPSADLKRMLNINVSPPAQVPAPRSIPASGTDAVKSSALLALLRSGSTAEMRDVPNTPREQISFPPQVQNSSHRPRPQAAHLPSMASVSQVQVSPESWHPAISQLENVPVGFRQLQQVPTFRSQQAPALLSQFPGERSWQDVPDASLQRFAPYQNTGNPQFSHSKGEFSSISAVPPANALPKLTSHTKSLLDAFKMSPATDLSLLSAQAPAVSSVQYAKTPSIQSQTLLDIFKAKPREASLSPNSPPAPSATSQPFGGSTLAATRIHTPKSDGRQDPTDILRQRSSIPTIIGQAQQPIGIDWHPAELAADVTPQTHAGSKRDKTKSTANKRDRPAAPREGETAATITGPLNQPQFDGIMRSVRKPANGDRRSPAPANKTLFDHRNPTPVKILARPDEARGSPARSPNPPKVNPPSSSPRRAATPKEVKELAKPFQPQILRRPQTPSKASVQSRKENIPDALMAAVLAQPAVETAQQRPSQADSHRQALLSLFNNPLQTSQTLPVVHDPLSAVSTTVPASQPISPLTDSQLHSLEPISTRSRVDSLASSGGAKHPGAEKRHTAAGDKAFLLGYLGRIASQGGK
jgi:mRNA-decapping enzyme subunit 2